MLASVRRRRLLVVDDHETIRTALTDALVSADLEVESAESGTAALAMLDRFAPDVVLTDVRMPDIDGLVLLRIVRERVPDIDVVLMTAFDDMSTVVTAMRDGAVEFLVKPLDLMELHALIDRIFADRRTRSTERRGTKGHVEPDFALIGRDPKMIAVYKLVGQAAATNAPVLVRGESGTGKELVARGIHANSARAAEPFVPVNCASLPTTLLESELFGHVRGAFTGAVNPRRGRFELAGKGTIFLDEIGDTSPDFQSKLLRVLQNREFQAVGDEETRRAEARVIAATHQNLEAMVSARSFREDLYYRLRVVEIALPPLRDRLSDIPLLAEHILRRAAAQLGTQPAVLSREALDRLATHTWPGNVRELENCLARAIVVASGSVIRSEHLSISSPVGEQAAPLPTLLDLEREHVGRVLAATRGHKGRAADLLGVSRPRLNRLIEKYGLE
jgi:DNA-binding NtrC family response regulator